MTITPDDVAELRKIIIDGEIRLSAFTFVRVSTLLGALEAAWAENERLRTLLYQDISIGKHGYGVDE